MWEVKTRIRQLLESTSTTTEQLAGMMRERGDRTVSGSQLRRELHSEAQPTALWAGRLMEALQVLTELQEDRNVRVRTAVRRADKALAKAE